LGKREEEKKGGLRVKKKACVCVSEKKREKSERKGIVKQEKRGTNQAPRTQ